MTSYNQVNDYIYDIFSEYRDENGKITPYNIDSFIFIQLMLKIEDEFDIEFDEDMLSYDVLEDIPALINYVLEEIDE